MIYNFGHTHKLKCLQFLRAAMFVQIQFLMFTVPGQNTGFGIRIGSCLQVRLGHLFSVILTSLFFLSLEKNLRQFDSKKNFLILGHSNNRHIREKGKCLAHDLNGQIHQLRYFERLFLWDFSCGTNNFSEQLPSTKLEPQAKIPLSTPCNATYRTQCMDQIGDVPLPCRLTCKAQPACHTFRQSWPPEPQHRTISILAAILLN